MSDSPDRKPGSGLTPESFQLLLDWLDADAERAARKYEEIRRGLTVMFANRRHADAEDLADETIDRVARKLPEVKLNYQGDPARYFYAVAKNVLFSRLRDERRSAPPPPPPPAEEDAAETDRLYECMDKCVQSLSPGNRSLILRYYEAKGQAKIDAHRELASKLAIGSDALRVRTHRIRSALRKCMEECMRVREE